MIKYDIVIIGSGWSGGGCYAQLKKLCPDNLRIVVIERGDIFRPTEEDLTIPYAPTEKIFKTFAISRIGKSNFGLTASSVGGASHFNQVCALETKDFINSCFNGQILDLDKFYEDYVQFQKLLSSPDSEFSQTDLAVIRACKKMGLKSNANYELPIFEDYSFGTLYRFYGTDGRKKSILDILPEKSYGADIMPNTEALRISYDTNLMPRYVLVRDDKNQISKVHLADNGIVIVSCGPIFTPKLLLASKLKTKYKNEFIGENFKDRPGIGIGLFSFDQSKFQKLVNFGAMFHDSGVEIIKNQNTYAALIVYAFGYVSKLGYFFLSFLNKFDFFNFTNRLMSKITGFVIFLEDVRSSGTITLKDLKTPTQLVVKSDNFSDSSDLYRFVQEIPKCLELYMNILNELSPLERIINKVKNFIYYRKLFSNDPKKIADYIMKYNQSLCHYVGACAHGTALENDFSVKGVKNTYVADLSAAPVVHKTNPSMLSLFVGHYVGTTIAKKLHR